MPSSNRVLTNFPSEKSPKNLHSFEILPASMLERWSTSDWLIEITSYVLQEGQFVPSIRESNRDVHSPSCTGFGSTFDRPEPPDYTALFRAKFCQF